MSYQRKVRHDDMAMVCAFYEWQRGHMPRDKTLTSLDIGNNMHMAVLLYLI